MGKKLLGALLLYAAMPAFVHGQAVSPAKPKTAYLSIGGFYSYGQMDYGQHHSSGEGGYLDINYLVYRNIGAGLEGEFRDIDFQIKSNTSYMNLIGGPRITYHMRHFEPYVKYLAGGSRFHYPDFITKKTYDYNTTAIGGGLDIRLSGRWYLRGADFERQRFTNYPPYGLTPWVFSAGVSYRLF